MINPWVLRLFQLVNPGPYCCYEYVDLLTGNRKLSILMVVTQPQVTGLDRHASMRHKQTGRGRPSSCNESVTINELGALGSLHWYRQRKLTDCRSDSSPLISGLFHALQHVYKTRILRKLVRLVKGRAPLNSLEYNVSCDGPGDNLLASKNPEAIFSLFRRDDHAVSHSSQDSCRRLAVGRSTANLGSMNVFRRDRNC